MKLYAVYLFAVQTNCIDCIHVNQLHGLYTCSLMNEFMQHQTKFSKAIHEVFPHFFSQHFLQEYHSQHSEVTEWEHSASLDSEKYQLCHRQKNHVHL